MRTIPRNYPTFYELAAENLDDKRRVLVAYCRRKGRKAIYDSLANRLEHVKSLFGTSQIDWAAQAKDGAMMGRWRIHWTGRTEREAQGRRLLYIGAAADLGKALTAGKAGAA